MNLPGTQESSSKRKENGDAAEPDRPLKKARYAWEVKGKYHLRNEMSDIKPAVNDSEMAGSSSDQYKEQNLEILGDYLLNHEFPSQSTCMLPNSSVSSDLPYPRYVSSLEKAGSDSSSSNDENTPLDKPVGYSYKEAEDLCILRWQARQLSKCFVDNTINSVIDGFMITPLPAHMDNGVLALDAAEFNNNLPGDNSIENEAILMAISAHGLQNNSNSSISNTNESHNSNNELFLSPPHSPLEKESIIKESQEENLSNDWTYTRDNETSAPLFSPESSNSSYQYLSEDNVNSNMYDGEENALNDMNNHYDFLDAAVSFAIQYKGLTSYGTDYG